MKVRATVHLQPDSLGFAPVPGQVFDIDPKAPGMERLLNAGLLLAIEPQEPAPEHTAGVAGPQSDESASDEPKSRKAQRASEKAEDAAQPSAAS